MASSLGFMTINETVKTPEAFKINESLQKKIPSAKAQEVINRLYSNENEDDLGNYDENYQDHTLDDDDLAEPSEALRQGEYINQYYNEYASMPPTQNVESELMTKVNYMIQLLEENTDEKISSVTEEMVLYCFLGIFTIFMIDSFIRVGKYVR